MAINMIKQFLRKRFKIVMGFLNTYIRKKGQLYDDTDWWDTSFYTEGVSDRQTISQKKSVISAKYHYNSMELQILKHLRNNKIQLRRSNVLDIGSGSGHWIDFYKTIGASEITGMDVSNSSHKHLVQKYSQNAKIEIHKGKALEVIENLQSSYELVNAVGVMFHIVDDDEWQDTIFSLANVLKDNGLFIVGGHFGLLDGLNVQIDNEGNINKRLRSKIRWIRVLKKAGFTSIKVYRNNAYLRIYDSLPENHVLIATK